MKGAHFMQSVAKTCLPRLWVPLMLLVAGVMAPEVHAADAAGGADTSTPRFAINRYEVDGNTLLKPAEIEAATAGLTGAQKNFGDIQRALELLEEVPHNGCHGTTT